MIGVVLGFALAMAGGCASTQMRTLETHQETLQGVLVSKDGQYLVALTDRQDYVFKHPGALAKVITGELHPYATARLGGFRVDGKGRTRGMVTLELRKVPEALRPQALALGCTERWYGNFELVQVIDGTSYERSARDLPEIKLNRSYEVEVERVGPITDSRRSPLEAVRDVGLGIFGLPLLLIMAPHYDNYR